MPRKSRRSLPGLELRNVICTASPAGVTTAFNSVTRAASFSSGAALSVETARWSRSGRRSRA